MRSTNVERQPEAGSTDVGRNANEPVSATAAVKRRRTSSRKQTPEPAFHEESLAQFAPSEVAPADAEMWPMHSTVWLQPELAARIPESSGLYIERRHKVPAPDFLPFEIAPHDSAHAIDQECRTLVPAANAFPESDLTPIGWDPRTLASEKGETE